MKSTSKWIKEKNREHDFFGRAAKRYGRQLEKRYGTVRIMGMDAPISLRTIFTRVNILQKITSRQWETVDDLARNFDYDRRGFGVKKQTVSGLEIVNKNDKFIILGKPGAGKTTFLKYIALQSLDGIFRTKRLPVFIGLKDLADTPGSLVDFIVRQFEICRFEESKDFIERMLEAGKCQLLFDGLDEVDKSREEQIVREITYFTERYSDNQYIISCRIAAYNYLFDKFTDVELADFDENQIHNFIINWFGEDRKKAALCWDELRKNKPIRELCSIPLLLTLMCLAFDSTMSFPKNRAELYEEALDALLKKWDSLRGIKREEVYKNLSIRRKESLLSHIAAATFEKDEYFLPQRKLKRYIADFIQHLVTSKDDTLDIDSEAILKSIEAQHGLFVERARGIYSFSHLTFQEYFTAKYLVDHAADGLLQKAVHNYFLMDKWREVFLITAGMLERADEFLLLIVASIKTSVEQRLDSFLRRMEDLVQSQEALWTCLRIPLPLARTIALARTLDYALTLASTVDPGLPQARTLSVDIARGLPAAFNFQLDDKYRVAIETALDPSRTNDLSKALDEIFNQARKASANNATLVSIERALAFGREGPRRLGHELAQYKSRDLVKDMVTYLKASQLLIACLRTECYVSKKTRQQIGESLLRNV